MKNATFRQLRVFSAIARLGSFTRAAEEMHLTQPTLSMQVRKLGLTAGLPLFEQIGKKVYLTDAGRALQEFCREVFDALARFEMTVAALKGLKSGRLRLAVVSTAEYFLPRLLGPFSADHPGVEFTLEVLNRERMIERLKANADDLYVFGFPPDDVEVESVRFMENPLVVVARQDHPLARDRRIPLARLMAEPFLMREPGSGTRSAAERFFAEHGAHPRVRMELGSNEAIKQAVLGGLGVSVLSRHTIEHASGLVELDIQGFPLVRHWYLVRPKGKRASVVAGAFCAYLARVTEPRVGLWA
ncbi:MAG: LysR family transcriptional regulator [Rhodospirillales bacterium]|nr:LysR family transcriptional regulator [Rhodospirillales bacterium]